MIRENKIMGDKIRIGRHDGRIQKMLYENRGNGNDTRRQNVAENI